MPFNLSTGELIVFFVVAVLVFGRKLPDVARKVGRAFSEFKHGMSSEMRKIEADLPAPEDPRPERWEPPADSEECPGLDGP